MIRSLVASAAILALAPPLSAAFIYLDEFQQSASPPQYDPKVEFEVCLPKELPNVILKDGTDRGELWCHNFTGWIRMKDDPGGWLDISGMQLGFSFRSWTVWDYATACVIALRESDFERLKAMSDEASQANFKKMIEEENPNSVPKILQQAHALRALCHIRKDDIEWLFLEIYFVDRMPNMMALSLRKNSAFTHQFVDVKIQDQPSVHNAFIYFSYELSRAAREAIEKQTKDTHFGPNSYAPQIGATPRQPKSKDNLPQTTETTPSPTPQP
jgi:hypothetical protein